MTLTMTIAMQFSLNDWLHHRDSRIIAGSPFNDGNNSCLPVSHAEEKLPVGFLVNDGTDVAYVPAQTPDGARMLDAWTKAHTIELIEQAPPLPADYWYG